MSNNYQIIILFFLFLMVVRAVSIYIETRKKGAIVAIHKKKLRSFIMAGMIILIGALWFYDDYYLMERSISENSIIPLGIFIYDHRCYSYDSGFMD